MNIRRTTALSGLLVAISTAPLLADTGIRMLPPVQDTTTEAVCLQSEGAKLLSWDGEHAIKCNKSIVVAEPPNQILTIKKTSGSYGAPATSGVLQPSAAFRIQQSPAVMDFGRDTNGVFWMQNGSESNLATEYPIALNPNGGTVGVGTATPAAMLDVAGGVKVANDSNPCSATNAGTIRWTGAAMEYCNGTDWVGFYPPSLTPTSISYAGTAIGFVHDTTKTIQTGTFTKADGYVAGQIICGGGNNRISAYLTLNNTPIVAATGQDVPAPADYWEIDASSFFSYVPKNTPWAVVVRACENATKNGGANCTLKITKFGD